METIDNQKKNQTDEIVITDFGEVLNLSEYDEAMAQFNEWYADQLAMQF